MLVVTLETIANRKVHGRNTLHIMLDSVAKLCYLNYWALYCMQYFSVSNVKLLSLYYLSLLFFFLLQWPHIGAPERSEHVISNYLCQSYNIFFHSILKLSTHAMSSVASWKVEVHWADTRDWLVALGDKVPWAIKKKKVEADMTHLKAKSS